MKQTILLFGIVLSHLLFAQKVQYYEHEGGDRHVCGVFSLDVLEKDTIYRKWYNKSYHNFNLSGKKTAWSKNLKDVEVDIYMGTWCGDSKRWLPMFVKLWDDLGLKRNQLKFIALYDFAEKYKQGPNGEEKNKDIHRVPTFIFKRNGKEISRIVESPNNDLETDVAQIALGYPSKPNYRGATYMIELLKSDSIDGIKSNSKHINAVYRLLEGLSELNTLGYVYVESGRIDKALVVLYYNTLFYRYEPNVYDSYGEALAKAGQIEEAIENYRKVLLLDRSNKHAIEQIKKLEKKT